MTERFEYKPALLSVKHVVEVSETALRLTKGDNTTEIPFAEIDVVRFWSMKVQRIDYLGLEFTARNGQRIHLHINTPSMLQHSDPDRDAFAQIMAASLDRLTVLRPDIEIELGQRKIYKWLTFALGVACLVFAIGFPLAAMSDGRGDRLVAAIIPIVLLGLLGGVLAWSFWPLRPPQKLSSEDVRRLLGLTEPK